MVDLNQDECIELGSLQQRISATLREIINPEQIYVCLWSHKDGIPVHTHYLIQPVTKDMMLNHGHEPENLLNMFKPKIQPKKIILKIYV